MLFTKDNVVLTKINWSAPTSRTDGTPYGAADHAGYELGVSDAQGAITPWVAVPAAYDITEWPINELNITTEGEHTVVMRTVDSGGRSSEWSDPLVFTALVAAPNAPAALAAF